MQLRTFLTTAVAAAATLAFALPSAMAETKYKSEYRMSLVLGTAFPWGKGGELWADKVRERTQGRINIKLYPGTSLVQGDQTREFSAIRQGVIDMAVGSTINWSPQVKALNLFSLPFLFPDYAAVDAVVQGDTGKEIFKTIDKAGVLPLAWGENGYREISNSKHAIAKPAMASSAVDGQENPIAVYMAAKLQSVGQKHMTLWGYMNDPLIYVVNKDVWASWTPADQAIVKQAALDAAKEQIAIARKGLVEPGKPLVKDLEGLGVTVVDLNAAQRKVFADATKSVYTKWKPQIGTNLVDMAEKAIAGSRK